MAGVSAERLIPPAFVFLWSTGFVTARLVAGHSEPFTFLIWRFAIAGAVLALVAAFAGVRWPRPSLALTTPMVAGVLIHGAYLGAVFWSVSQGLPAGVSALIASLQPILTAALARPLLGETGECETLVRHRGGGARRASRDLAQARPCGGGSDPALAGGDLRARDGEPHLRHAFPEAFRR